MKTWNIIFATLVIFTAGIFTGALLVITSERAHNCRPPAAPVPTQAQPETPPPSPAASSPTQRLTLPFGINPKHKTSKDFLDRLDTELKLTPEQHTQVEKIITDGQQHAAQIWSTVAPQIREEVRTAREQIRATLTPEQRVRFEELMKMRPAKTPETAAPTATTNPPDATNLPAELPAR